MVILFKKIFVFTYFFMRLKFIFCSERMKTIQTIRIPIIFEVIPFNSADIFVYGNTSLLFLFGIIKIIICFSQFELIFET